jgi:cytochrome c553
MLWASSPPKQLALCITCHGQNGIAIQKNWPNLNGQSAKYIIKQLQDYQSGQRIAPLMQPYAKLLSYQDMQELAEFYANLPSQTSFKKPVSKIYQQGQRQKKIPACSACHGPQGNGNDFAKFPKLVGQHQNYLQEQLLAFKKHQRQNDPYHMMQDISQRLSNKDIQEITEFLDND